MIIQNDTLFFDDTLKTELHKSRIKGYYLESDSLIIYIEGMDKVVRLSSLDFESSQLAYENYLTLVNLNLRSTI